MPAWQQQHQLNASCQVMRHADRQAVVGGDLAKAPTACAVGSGSGAALLVFDALRHVGVTKLVSHCVQPALGPHYPRADGIGRT